ncbi:metallophosphoesterase [Bacillus sp. JCM 19041]|uniref:metallophosphoesterase n=1 Tax=Bacillus sp. JCM 19041 TaxID=1460637 RepID=UPI0006D1EE7C
MTTVITSLLFILIYIMLVFYIGFNAWRWLKATFSLRQKWIVTILFIFLSSAFFLSYLFPSFLLELIGGYWLAIVGYSLILLPIANMLYWLSGKKRKWKIGIGYVLSVFFIFGLVYGSINAWSPVVREYDVKLDNANRDQQGEELKLLIAADLHLGNLIGERHLQRFIETVNKEQPDLVLLAGDIIENNITPYFQNNLSSIMDEMSAPLGIYAVPGNHDYYGGDLHLLKTEFNTLGFHFLMDDEINVDGKLTIVGRKDYTDSERHTLPELIEDTNEQLPIVVLDHQPREIDVARDSGVDLIISGHTHRGQLFPANLITSALYDNDWGYLHDEQLHSFTTSGFGFWGPALRIGSRSEVMVVNLSF